MSKGVQLSRIWYLLAFLGSLIGQAKETKIICTIVTLYMYMCIYTILTSILHYRLITLVLGRRISAPFL